MRKIFLMTSDDVVGFCQSIVVAAGRISFCGKSSLSPHPYTNKSIHHVCPQHCSNLSPCPLDLDSSPRRAEYVCDWKPLSSLRSLPGSEGSEGFQPQGHGMEATKASLVASSSSEP